MEKIIMTAGIIASIVLAFVGAIKMPFGKFKNKHPKWYRAVFCLLSIILSLGIPVLCQIYIVKGKLLGLDFLLLELMTVVGVFVPYTAYEGLGLKQLFKIIVSKTAQLFGNGNNKKLAKNARKILDKYGFTQFVDALNVAQEEKAKLEAEKIAKQNAKTTEQKTENN